jgi:hypothetical protein
MRDRNTVTERRDDIHETSRLVCHQLTVTPFPSLRWNNRERHLLPAAAARINAFAQMFVICGVGWRHRTHSGLR